jgi:hypothetical protein
MSKCERQKADTDIKRTRKIACKHNGAEGGRDEAPLAES